MTASMPGGEDCICTAHSVAGFWNVPTGRGAWTACPIHPAKWTPREPAYALPTRMHAAAALLIAHAGEAELRGERVVQVDIRVCSILADLLIEVADALEGKAV